MSQRLFLVLACLAVLLTACALGKPTTVSDFKSDCMFPMSGSLRDDNFCGGDSMRICKDFEDMLSEKYASREQCMKQCGALRAEQYQQHVMDGCRRNVDHAFMLCGNFCQRNYPQ